MVSIDPYRTEDDSVTFYNDEFGEYYHSKTGALEEAFEKYAKAAGLDATDTKTVAILDFCFGLGYNTLAGLVELMKNPAVGSISVVSVANVPLILEKIARLDIGFPEYDLLRRLADETKVSEMIDGKQVELKLIVDDGADAIEELDSDQFDVVFFDPFSPRKCPSLWTQEIFDRMFALMRRRGLLITYSCARKVRDGLRSAGFAVSDGPAVKRWAPSTHARKP